MRLLYLTATRESPSLRFVTVAPYSGFYTGRPASYYAHGETRDAIFALLNRAKHEQQQGHTARVTNGRKDKGPPQVGG